MSTSIRLYGNLATKIANKAQNTAAPMTNVSSISLPVVELALLDIVCYWIASKP